MRILIKRWAIIQGSAISQVEVRSYGKKNRNQNVLTIFPSKKQAEEWRNTWKNKEALELRRIEIMMLPKP